jgi:hypothetical protein
MDDMHSGSRRVIARRLKNHAAQVNKLVKELKPPLALVPLRLFTPSGSEGGKRGKAGSLRSKSGERKVVWVCSSLKKKDSNIHWNSNLKGSQGISRDLKGSQGISTDLNRAKAS